MPELGGDQLLKQRVLGAAGDENVTAIGERDELQGVFQALLRGHVAGDDGESAHIQLRRIQREKNGERVVGSWVGVDDYLLGGCCRYGECCNQEGDEWKVEWTDANVARSHYRWNCH